MAALIMGLVAAWIRGSIAAALVARRAGGNLSWGARLMLALALFLVGCNAPQGPALVSAKSPPTSYTQSSASEPEPITSLPPGAANLSRAPGAVAPNTASVVVPGF